MLQGFGKTMNVSHLAQYLAINNFSINVSIIKKQRRHKCVKWLYKATNQEIFLTQFVTLFAFVLI